jgi:uncharacterized membrane protein
MAKQTQQNRLAKNNRNELMLEQSTTYDDSFLPAASEMEKLKEIDPNIIQWILSRAEMEQNARIEYNREIIDINRFNLKKEHRFNTTALFLAFVLFIFALGISAFFVIRGFEVQGTIFGGSALIMGVVFFISAAYNKKR